MASLIENLIIVLKDEYTVYQELLPVAMEKTKIIVKNDLAALQAITGIEQTAVDRIHILEQKREDIMTNIRTVVGKKADGMNLTNLVQLLDKQPKEQRELSQLRDKLHDMIKRLSEVNHQNGLLIQQSLDMIEFNMNFIQSTRLVPGNNNYTKGASAYDGQSYGKGLFDAKQ